MGSKRRKQGKLPVGSQRSTDGSTSLDSRYSAFEERLSKLEKDNSELKKDNSELKNEIYILKYKLQRTRNELNELKLSLRYRDMASRITLNPNRIQTTVEDETFPNNAKTYLKRSNEERKGRNGKPYQVEDSRVNKVKRKFHSVAHGNPRKEKKPVTKKKKPVTKNYVPLTFETKAEHNRMLSQAREYRKDKSKTFVPLGQDKKPLKRSADGGSFSPIGSKTNVGSLLGRSTVVNTYGPMDSVLARHRNWWANRAAAMSQKSGSVISNSNPKSSPRGK